MKHYVFDKPVYSLYVLLQNNFISLQIICTLRVCLQSISQTAIMKFPYTCITRGRIHVYVINICALETQFHQLHFLTQRVNCIHLFLGFVAIVLMSKMMH